MVDQLFVHWQITMINDDYQLLNTMLAFFPGPVGGGDNRIDVTEVQNEDTIQRDS